MVVPTFSSGTGRLFSRIPGFMKSLIIYLIAGFHRLLPFSVNRWVGRQYGRCLYFTHSRYARTSFTNLEHIFSERSHKENQQLVYQSCLHTGMMIAESFWLWQQSLEKINQRIISVKGQELIESAINEGKPVLLTGPHMGNWEAFSIWFGIHFNTAVMYRPAKIKVLDRLIRKGRSLTGTQLIKGEKRSVRKILRHLKSKGILFILSDQEPDKGSGVYADFMGKPAYTMTLVQKLMQKTQAMPLIFRTERVSKGFAINISEALSLDVDATPEKFAGQLNQLLEQQIMINPSQYEWGYKRFKSPPDGDYDFYPE